MAKANEGFKVLDHGPIVRLDEGLWRVEGSLEGMPLKRVMTVAKRGDGLLVIHNAIALRDAEMKELESFGPVGFIVVPNGWHRLDAPAFKKRYASAKIVCPPGARKKVEEVVPVDLVYEDFPADEHVTLRALAGVKAAEGVMTVKTPSGTTLVFNDAIFNMPHLSGMQGFLLKYVTQSSGGPRVSRLFRLFGIKDKAAYRADLESLAATPGLVRIIVSHHETIEADAANVLRSVAASV